MDTGKYDTIRVRRRGTAEWMEFEQRITYVVSRSEFNSVWIISPWYKTLEQVNNYYQGRNEFCMEFLTKVNQESVTSINDKYKCNCEWVLVLREGCKCGGT